jgi:aryl-phospho-beta-D-glucosidase BglC (GH1 family)
METVNDMGMGWNLGNTFESFGSFENIKTPDDQIKYWGNKVPKRELFQNIKKYGFKTIRLQFDLESDATTEQMDSLKKLTERYCVVYQTLVKGVSVETRFHNS